MEVLLLLHEPLLAASLKVIVAPAQTVVDPLILPAFGNGLTTTDTVVYAVPQLFVIE